MPSSRPAAQPSSPSTSLLAAESSALLVVDVQEKLAPAIAGGAAALERIGLVLEAALALQVPVLASEQYPQGLGPTVPDLSARLPESLRIAKTHFSCLREARFAERWFALGRRQVLICGMEAHVCVLQTALDFAAAGIETFILADGIGSRRDANRQLALQRLAMAGVMPLPAESAVFEWLGDSDNSAFRSLIARIRDSGH
ncbi:hydrolase [Algihabitans albus]|uniref:hydrolase n=1 Tax=Algihabitans albus TaxID=2164067 RepID=UPI0013C30A6A|nr:hydrolase [Algihabitans albus]